MAVVVIPLSRSGLHLSWIGGWDLQCNKKEIFLITDEVNNSVRTEVRVLVTWDACSRPHLNLYVGGPVRRYRGHMG